MLCMQKLEKCHREVSLLTASMREKETYEQLNAKVSNCLSMYAASYTVHRYVEAVRSMTRYALLYSTPF